MHNRNFVCIIISFLFMTSPPAWSADSPADMVDRGNTAYFSGDYDTALSIYEAASAKAPDSPQLFFNRGAALYQKREYSAASEAFEKAARKSRDTRLEAESNYNLGNCTFREAEGYREIAPDRFLDACMTSIHYYYKALRLSPDLIQAAENIEVVRLAMLDIADGTNLERKKAETQQEAEKQITETLKELVEEQARVLDWNQRLDTRAVDGIDFFEMSRWMPELAGNQKTIQIRTEDLAREIAGTNGKDAESTSGNPVKRHLAAEQGSDRYSPEIPQRIKKLAKDQKALQTRTEKLARNMSGQGKRIPKPTSESPVEKHLDSAAREQKEALNNLDKAKPSEAAVHQEKALQELEEALSSLDNKRDMHAAEEIEELIQAQQAVLGQNRDLDTGEDSSIDSPGTAQQMQEFADTAKELQRLAEELAGNRSDAGEKHSYSEESIAEKLIDNAAKEQREASKNLERNRPIEATANQEKALQKLEKALLSLNLPQDRKIAKEIKELMKAQQEAMDRNKGTESKKSSNTDYPEVHPYMRELARDQLALQALVEDLARDMPEPGGQNTEPSSTNPAEEYLKNAAKEQNEASSNLERNNPSEAAANQEKALEALEEALSSADISQDRQAAEKLKTLIEKQQKILGLTKAQEDDEDRPQSISPSRKAKQSTPPKKSPRVSSTRDIKSKGSVPLKSDKGTPAGIPGATKSEKVPSEQNDGTKQVKQGALKKEPGPRKAEDGALQKGSGASDPEQGDPNKTDGNIQAERGYAKSRKPEDFEQHDLMQKLSQSQKELQARTSRLVKKMPGPGGKSARGTESPAKSHLEKALREQNEASINLEKDNGEKAAAHQATALEELKAALSSLLREQEDGNLRYERPGSEKIKQQDGGRKREYGGDTQTREVKFKQDRSGAFKQEQRDGYERDRQRGDDWEQPGGSGQARQKYALSPHQSPRDEEKEQEHRGSLMQFTEDARDILDEEMADRRQGGMKGSGGFIEVDKDW